MPTKLAIYFMIKKQQSNIYNNKGDENETKINTKMNP